MTTDKSNTDLIELNVSELEAVAAGDPLINVSDVNVPVNAAAAVNVLGAPTGALATSPAPSNPAGKRAAGAKAPAAAGEAESPPETFPLAALAKAARLKDDSADAESSSAR